MLLLDSRRGRASPTEASISALSLVGANIAERGTSLKCWRDLSEAANRVGATTEASRSDRRSAIPSQLCIERSTGDTIRRKGLILAGYRRAQRALVEAAWTYHYPARASETLRARLEGLRRACATSPERRRFACAPGIAASAPQARTAGRGGRNRPRDGRLPVGHRIRRSRRRKAKAQVSTIPLRRAGSPAGQKFEHAAQQIVLAGVRPLRSRWLTIRSRRFPPVEAKVAESGA